MSRLLFQIFAIVLATGLVQGLGDDEGFVFETEKANDTNGGLQRLRVPPPQPDLLSSNTGSTSTTTPGSNIPSSTPDLSTPTQDPNTPTPTPDPNTPAPSPDPNTPAPSPDPYTPTPTPDTSTATPTPDTSTKDCSTTNSSANTNTYDDGKDGKGKKKSIFLLLLIKSSETETLYSQKDYVSN